MNRAKCQRTFAFVSPSAGKEMIAPIAGGIGEQTPIASCRPRVRARVTMAAYADENLSTFNEKSDRLSRDKV
jgi:hypothetical protein